MARSRRKAREAALVTLYQLDLMRAGLDPLAVVKDVCEGMTLADDQAAYATELVGGIAKNRERIDHELSTRLHDYELDRVAAVDRAVLRIAAYELLFIDWLAPAITISEAIVIVRKYSTAESGKFVNGVLGRLVRESDKADWDPAKAEGHDTEAPEPEPEVVEEEITPDSEEAQELIKVGWKIKSDE
jgi:transcription antitermination protein NusB